MNRRPLVNVAQSVHQRLLTRAKEEQRPFNELLQHYAIERFLYRLGRSSHTDKLLLKGALLLRVWQIPRARPTMDIDVLGRVAGAPEAIAEILRECMTLEVEDDGMQYEPKSITIEAITLDAEYQGWRIRFKGALGNARVDLLAEHCPEAPAPLPFPVDIDPYVIEINFEDADRIPGENARYYLDLPTTFKLSGMQVDRLTDIGPKLLEASPEYQCLVAVIEAESEGRPRPDECPVGAGIRGM